MKPSSRTPRTPRTALAAVTLTLAVLATACGSGSDPASTEGKADGKPVTLTFWTWTSGAKEATEEFNRTHKDIQIKFSQIPGGPDGYSKISNAIKAGNAPDVTTIEYQALPEFVSQGDLQDLSDLAGDTVRNEFPESVQNLVNLGGKSWAVPFDIAPQILYYRKDLYEKYGVEVPRTWDEFRSAAEKIKKAEPKARIASFGTDAMMLAALSWQAGAKWFSTEDDAWKVNINDATSQKVAEYWEGMRQGGLVFDYAPYSEEETKSRLDGTTTSILGASWSAGGFSVNMPTLKGKWAAAPMPNWGTDASGSYGGSSYAVPKGGKNAEAAVEFIKWLTTEPDSMVARIKSQTSPSSTLPANPAMEKVASEAFDTSSYFGGQDLYALAHDQVATIPTGWVWGPVQSSVKIKIEEVESKEGPPQGSRCGPGGSGVHDQGPWSEARGVR
ncbi:ABC transporter substrate-binding protein [Streptomyces formicae]|uniref:ABC transporter substrate-binding protein n=1 Tax=Streptomyces formicae TaxID=1616117 RepID=UPI001F5A44F1|nr:sugar ABC transporter substrate-binding protein [Streptomyces formicae]